MQYFYIICFFYIRITGFYKLVEESNLRNAILQKKWTRILVMGRGLSKLLVWVEVGKRSLWIIGYTLAMFQVFMPFLLALFSGWKWTILHLFQIYTYSQSSKYFMHIRKKFHFLRRLIKMTVKQAWVSTVKLEDWETKYMLCLTWLAWVPGENFKRWDIWIRNPGCRGNKLVKQRTASIS